MSKEEYTFDPVEEFLKQCEEHNFSVAKSLLQADKEMLNNQDALNNGLSYACEAGNSMMTSFLLKKGANPNERDDSSSLPLENALFSNDTNTIKALLQYGLDLTERDCDGRLPLEAIENNEEFINNREKYAPIFYRLKAIEKKQLSELQKLEQQHYTSNHSAMFAHPSHPERNESVLQNAVFEEAWQNDHAQSQGNNASILEDVWQGNQNTSEIQNQNNQTTAEAEESQLRPLSEMNELTSSQSPRSQQGSNYSHGINQARQRLGFSGVASAPLSHENQAQANNTSTHGRQVASCNDDDDIIGNLSQLLQSRL